MIFTIEARRRGTVFRFTADRAFKISQDAMTMTEQAAMSEFSRVCDPDWLLMDGFDGGSLEIRVIRHHPDGEVVVMEKTVEIPEIRS